jgi:hypothetical protein
MPGSVQCCTRWRSSVAWAMAALVKESSAASALGQQTMARSRCAAQLLHAAANEAAPCTTIGMQVNWSWHVPGSLGLHASGVCSSVCSLFSVAGHFCAHPLLLLLMV